MKASYSYPRKRSTLADAKSRLSIHTLWIHFGFAGKSSASCRCPWRDDRKPSFSVNTDGTLWHDFAKGEGGDAVDFLQRASGLSQKDACRKFIEFADERFIITPHAARRNHPQPAKTRPSFPDFRTGTAADFKQLASLRKIGREGLEWTGERGLLRFATLKDFPAWIVTDSARVNAQARRMDGEPWAHIEAKAWTLPGAWASWPIAIVLP